jgi:hypothetical protein
LDFDTMRKSPRLFRLTATVALTALLWDAALPLAALAQPSPPPLPPLPAPPAGQPDLAQADPPERVGRIAGITGTVSFHNQGDTQWSAASPNYPVSSGNAFWTEPSAQAQLEISDSRIGMAGATEFEVAALDASGLQGVAAQGEIYVHLRDLAPNEVWSIQTPRGLVRLSGEGRYEIVVGSTDQPTLITVVDGAAQIEGPGVSLQVAASQTATVAGTDSFQGSIGPAQRDPFLTARLDTERPPPAPSGPVPQQVVAMPGGSDLIGTGSWSEAPEYGQVWYPPVAASWVPYREGHWAYIAPWGWTWIDDAPWGFAPFHYGRWIEIGGRWAWTPGGIAVGGPPVYAPALVTFIGIGAGVAFGAALAAGSIGWVPLGPREPFHPWYHASNNYIRQVNVGHVTNINNTVVANNYVNRGAATAIPGAAMAGSRPVQAVARPVTAQEFAAARPISGQQPIRPTAATAGVTPVVARQLNLAPAGTVHPAPGPAVRAQQAGPNGFVRPAFTPGAGRPVPGAGLPSRPALSPPGARPAGVATPEPSRTSAAPPAEPRPGNPFTARPEGRPAAQRPAEAPPPGTARPVPQPQSRQTPLPSTPRAAPAAAATPRPVPQPVAPRFEPPRAAAATPRPVPPSAASTPRFEPPRAAAAAPRPAAPRAAPAPRPAARPAPQEQKKPGER